MDCPEEINGLPPKKPDRLFGGQAPRVQNVSFFLPADPLFLLQRSGKRLAELRGLPIVGDVRGRRLMMCVEYVRDKATRERLPDSCNISKRISNECEAHGLLVRPIGHLDVLSPPLIITKQEVDFVVDTLRAAIVKVSGELKTEGVI